MDAGPAHPQPPGVAGRAFVHLGRVGRDAAPVLRHAPRRLHVRQPRHRRRRGPMRRPTRRTTRAAWPASTAACTSAFPPTPASSSASASRSGSLPASSAAAGEHHDDDNLDAVATGPCRRRLGRARAADRRLARPRDRGDPDAAGGLLSLGRPGWVDELFAAAGFDEVATTRLDAPFRLPSARAYLDFVRSSASPIQQILGALGAAAADAAWSEMEERLSAFSTPTGWEGPNELLLTAGRRAAATASCGW